MNSPSPANSPSDPAATPGEDIRFGRSVIAAEAAVLLRLGPLLGASFSGAVEAILACEGRVVVTGMGKAGLIGQKIAATLASTGTPSFFMHPAEALHGDLGMLRREDIVLALSNSGETEEVVRLLPHVRDRLPIVAITRNEHSPLGQAATYLIALGHIEEACPLGLAPSASTTAMLAVGDALALTVERRRGFSDEDFARFHPGGSLGRRFQRVHEVMRRGERVPLVRAETSFVDAVKAFTHARAGAAVVVDDAQRLLGIFTNGDFRRAWTADPAVVGQPVGQHMTSPCKSIADIELVNTALRLMHQMRINELPVVNGDGAVVGLLDIQDIVA